MKMHQVLAVVLLAVAVVSAQKVRSDLSGVNALAIEATNTFCDLKTSDEIKTTRWNQCFLNKVPDYFITLMESCSNSLNLKLNSTEFLTQICNTPVVRNQYAGCIYNTILAPPTDDFMTKIASVGPNDIPDFKRTKRGLFDWLTGGSTNQAGAGTSGFGQQGAIGQNTNQRGLGGIGQNRNQGSYGSGFGFSQSGGGQNNNAADSPNFARAFKKRWATSANYNMPNFNSIARSGVQVPQDSVIVKFALQALQNCQKQYPS